jgi:hypothetical protein
MHCNQEVSEGRQQNRLWLELCTYISGRVSEKGAVYFENLFRI